jgi:tryptophan-rich sensory protein
VKNSFTPPGSLFYLLWAIIIAVSVHDWYLVIINHRSISKDERNPVGRWLIEVNDGGIAYFLIAILIGTIIAATVILLIHWSNRRLALVVAGVVSCFQILLLIYLSTE